MLNQIIKAILIGAIVVCGASAELQIKVRKVSHPDFKIASDGTFIVKN